MTIGFVVAIASIVTFVTPNIIINGIICVDSIVVSLVLWRVMTYFVVGSHW